LSATPVYEADFYSDAFIRDPWPHYARMRELGPVVWLPEHGNFALTRHATVLAALRNPDLFVSGRGVAACEFANEITRGNSAASDGDRHRAIREASSGPLTPEALEAIRGRIEQAAAELVDKLIAAGEFDAMADLAAHLPLTVVRELVGLPDFGRDNMLRWANATFNLLGVQNSRGRAALEVFSEQRRFVTAGATPDALRPDSWSRRLFDLVERGELAPDLAPVCMRDYLNPSLDTTISATGELIFRLAPSRPVGAAAGTSGPCPAGGERSGPTGLACSKLRAPRVVFSRDRGGRDSGGRPRHDAVRGGEPRRAGVRPARRLRRHSRSAAPSRFWRRHPYVPRSAPRPARNDRDPQSDAGANRTDRGR
jgi:hypothetical protein